MIDLPSAITDAVKSFAKISGVGEKTALRQVMQMVRWNQGDLENFASSIANLQLIKRCSECGLYSEEERCQICLSESRAASQMLCVVENINDLMAIERSNEYSGLYHVLGGVLNPLMGIGPEQLGLDKLVERVNKYNIQNIVLAINPSVEGDATCSYIKQLLNNVHIERIGFGIPMGGSLEFLDPLTISKALENRKRL